MLLRILTVVILGLLLLCNDGVTQTSYIDPGTVSPLPFVYFNAAMGGL